MPKPYLLDTNSYYILFQRPQSDCYPRLIDLLTHEGNQSFYISSLTSLEIRSVVGKYRRGGTTGSIDTCTRLIENQDGTFEECKKRWMAPPRKRMSKKLYIDINKIITEVEEQLTHIQPTILQLDDTAILHGQELLYRYADVHSFGSHDALIAGVILSQRDKGIELTLLTSDRGLKSVGRKAGISVLDPHLDL